MCVYWYPDQNHILLLRYLLWFILALIRKAEMKPSPPEPELNSDNKYHEFSKVLFNEKFRNTQHTSVVALGSITWYLYRSEESHIQLKINSSV